MNSNYGKLSLTEMYHHGILGQKWGVRRYQNEDGSLTPAGRDHYGYEGERKKSNALPKLTPERKEKLKKGLTSAGKQIRYTAAISNIDDVTGARLTADMISTERKKKKYGSNYDPTRGLADWEKTKKGLIQYNNMMTFGRGDPYTRAYLKSYEAYKVGELDSTRGEAFVDYYLDRLDEEFLDRWDRL